MDAAGLSVEQQALRLAFESLSPRAPGISFKQFARVAAECEVHAARAGGRLCGAVLVLGKEVHACILPWARGRWFGRAQAALLNRVIEQHGEAITTATTEEGRRFVERLGFIQDNEIYRRSKPWVLNHFSARGHR